MERITPMLGDLELQQVQQLDIEADQLLVEHEISGLEGDFLQREGRRATLITVSGIINGLSQEQFPEQTEALAPRARLQALREQFGSALPVTFVADIISATDIGDVLIEDMEITELAGRPNRFEYAFRLREYTAPPTEPTEAPPIEPPPQTLTATLVVEVIVENTPDFDFNRVTVTVEGTTSEGEALSRTLSNRVNNIWTEEDFPPGEYTVEATVLTNPQMRDSKSVTVRDGETANVTLTLRTDVVIAKMFMVHFRFDSAFVEPCLMHVLKQVNEFGGNNAADKCVILGHTDLAGSTTYNQSLSERRARAVYSALRFAGDQQAAVDEWNAIRRARASGVSLGDSWGAREYQQMLQDLGFYHGAIDGQHGPATESAVREFQSQNGLGVTGIVDDSGWPLLIHAYLQAYNLNIAETQFLPNCGGEHLKWLGCSELDPVRDVTFAWRPNRRCEILFVGDDSLPADVKQPDTFNLPTAGAVNSNWCLNTGNVSSRCCFVEPRLPPGKETCSPHRSPWPRQPAEPQPVFEVRGSITFGDGSPFVGRYTLIAPDGEFMDGEVPTSTSSQQAGTGIQGTTQADGSFTYPDADKFKRPGVFTLEVEGDFIIRNKEAPLADAKGPIACKRLASANDHFDVVIVPAALINIVLTITAPPLVVVKRSHTSPVRQPVVLQVNQSFSGSGEFTVNVSDRVTFFTSAAGGTPLLFNGVDNLFTDAQLVAGVTLFAEGGPNPSAILDDVTLTLQLVVGGQNGLAATAQITSVLITLAIAEPRVTGGGPPPNLSDTAKANPGRFVLPQNANGDRPRAMITVQPPQPLITNDLQLNVINNQLQLFTGENPRDPLPPQTSLPTSQILPASGIPAGGLHFFVEGVGVSLNFRSAAIQLGIAGLEADGDRVSLTVLNGDPSQPGLFSVGEHEYTEADEGSFVLPRPSTVTDNVDVFDPPGSGASTFSVRRRAVVRYPADNNGLNVPVSSEQDNYPLVLILHGNHRRLLDDDRTFVESYRGLEYLCRHLASHGYIALTIDADDINTRNDCIFHRGVAVLEHITVMKSRNTNPPAVGQVDLQGKIDESNLFLIGHSRGGEGVLAAETINQAKAQGHAIRGVISIAPTNSENISHTTTPLLVLYGSSDGDVSGIDDFVNPFLIYDRAAAPKNMIFVYGGIHNRFSTNADWLDPRFIDNDDPRIIGATEHLNIAEGYSNAFLENIIRGPIGFGTFFKDYDVPASVSGVQLHQQVQDPVSLTIDDFAQPAPTAAAPQFQRLAERATRNTVGNAVNQSGLVIPTAARGGAFLNSLTETELTNDFIDFFVHEGEGGLLAWDASGASYSSALGGLDAALFSVLSLRVTQRLGSSRFSSGVSLDFSVALSDGTNTASLLIGSRATVPAPFERHDHAALHGIPATSSRLVDRLPDSPSLSKCALKTIRLRLADFVNANSSLNLTALQTLTLTFDQSARGEIAINTIEFSQ